MRQLFFIIIQLSTTALLAQDLSEDMLGPDNLDNKSEYEFDQFVQVIPQFGEVSKLQTRATIYYDDEYLYAKIEALQPDTLHLTSFAMERDNKMTSDDYIDLIIDSYNDKSNALLFRVNTIGTQMDAEITQNGNSFNYNWNTYWFAEVGLNQRGWNVVFKIPFSSLRFKKSDVVAMGIKIVRYSKSLNELSIFPLNDEVMPSPHADCNNMEVIHFTQVKPRKPFYITPYMIANYDKNLLQNENSEAYYYHENYLNNKNYFENNVTDKVLSNMGLDIKIKPKSNQTIDLTYNTDFSQIETDDRIINLTRYSIAIPEKRTFFLENSETFNSNMFGHKLFHSRQIGIENGNSVPLLGGIKYTGGTNAYQVGVLSMQSSNSYNATNYSVARFKKAYGAKESYAGILVTNKENFNDHDFNRVMALDGIAAIGDVMKFEYFAAASVDTSDFNQDNLSYGIRLNRVASEGYRFDYRFREYRENFNPSMGFLPRSNNRRFTMNQGYRIRPENGKFWSLISTGIYITQYFESSTNLDDLFQINGYFNARDKNGNIWGMYLPMYNSDVLYSNWDISSKVSIREGKYEMWSVNPFFTNGNSKSYKYSFDLRVGQFYSGNKILFSGSFQYFVSKYWNLETYLSYNYIRFPKAFSDSRPVVERFLATTKINVFLSSRLSLKSFFQYDNLSKTLGTNIRLRYHPKEGSDLYLVFNQNYYSGNELEYNTRPDILSQNIAIKYTYTFIN